MKNLLKLTGGIAVAAVILTSSFGNVQANTTEVALEDISVVNEEITETMKAADWWVIASEDYVVAGGGE